jgi:hypothetical protein
MVRGEMSRRPRSSAEKSQNMIGRNEVSRALDGAFRAALMLTGSTTPPSMRCWMESPQQSSTALWVAAIQRRSEFAHQSEELPSCFPPELRRLFLFEPISRDCFVLRILLGLTPRTCSGILQLTNRRGRSHWRRSHSSKLATQVGHDRFPSKTGLVPANKKDYGTKLEIHRVPD